MALGKFKVLALAVIGSASLSACMYPYAEGGYGYDDGYGYDRTGYAWDEYCDPYYDVTYYSDCDYGYGYGQIGFGGGYWQNYYYPGYGLWLFDRSGGRHQMDDRHRRYWGHKRHEFRQGRGDFGRNNAWAGLSETQRAERRRQWVIENSGNIIGAGDRDNRHDRRDHDGRHAEGAGWSSGSATVPGSSSQPGAGSRGEWSGQRGDRRRGNGGVAVTPPQGEPVIAAPAPAPGQVERRQRRGGFGGDIIERARGPIGDSQRAAPSAPMTSDAPAPQQQAAPQRAPRMMRQAPSPQAAPAPQSAPPIAASPAPAPAPRAEPQRSRGGFGGGVIRRAIEARSGAAAGDQDGPN